MSLGLLAGMLVGACPRAEGYDVVQRGGRISKVTSLAFSGTNALLGSDDQRQTIDASEIDYYETFRRNLGQAGGNLVVFRTGALLRFETIEIVDGSVRVRVAGGSTFIVSESLIDFEASVREGAMVRLPASAGSSVAVSRSVGGGRSAAVYDEPPPSEDMSPPEYQEPPAAEASAPESGDITARPSRPGRAGFNRPRRFGADRGESSSSGGFQPQPLTPGDDSRDGGQTEGESVPFTPPGQSGNSGGGEQDAVGQTVLVVTTPYTGEIGGLQVAVSYPPNLRLAQPVQFSGFAASLAMATVNANIPGQVQLVAVNADQGGPGVQAGGEFLRLTFGWTDRPPSPMQFSVAVKATDPQTGADVPEFPREVSVF